MLTGKLKCPGPLRWATKVIVNHAVIGGTVNGTIKADKQLELQNGSRIEGDIITKSLIIEEGVFFEGHCSMSSVEGKPKQK